MTLQATSFPMVLMPTASGLHGITTATGSDVTFAFNGANDKVAFLFMADGTNIPDTVSFAVAAYTSTGGVDVTLETVDASAQPNGAVSGSTTQSASVSSTGVKNTTAGIAGSASLTAGTVYAIVLTATGTPNFTIRLSTGQSQGTMGFPVYLTKDSAGAWSAPSSGINSGICCGAENASGDYFVIPGFSGAFSSFAFQAFSNATNPDERGNTFLLPFPARIFGAYVFINMGSGPGANDDYTVNLYTSHTSSRVQQRTIAMDGNAQSSGLLHVIRFASAYDIAASTRFALAVKADGTEDVNMIRFDYQANADLGGMLGTGAYSTTANNGSDFTDDTAKLYTIFPLFSAFDDATGGGGGGLAANPLRGFL